MSGERNCLLPEILGFPKGDSLCKRFNKLKETFLAKFNIEPDIYIRVPGRVNLIGEHVDYCGYSVCPMAIDQDVLLAAKSVNEDPFLQVTNIDEKYSDYTINDENFSISHNDYDWCAYVLCGIRGGLEKLGKSSVSFRFAFSGTIPPGSGLSSSSAIVSASLLATTYLNKLILPKTELATLSAECEHYIGTAGGGMDQAIAFCATEGCAKHIEFNPLRTIDVILPPESVFVIAHSLVTKNKAESSDFNTRVVETRLAAQILAKKQLVNPTNKLRLADVQHELGVSLEKMISLVIGTFHKSPYSKQEICLELGMNEAEVNHRILTPDTRNINEFKLYQRALHVVEEARRVKEWLSAKSVQALGSLLNESHASLRDLYEASHPNLDKLAEDCIAAGALGVKLTGAGWGGAVVAITTHDHAPAFVETLSQTFYANYKGNIQDVLFVSQPGPGAQLFLSV